MFQERAHETSFDARKHIHRQFGVPSLGAI